VSAAADLRGAAARVRALAEAATGGPWFGVTGPGGYPNELRTGEGPDAGLPVLFDPHHLVGTAHYMRGTDAHYIAAMSPPVALALADWLDLVGSLLEQGFDENAETRAALALVAALPTNGADRG
jgi:hypothetical protein